MTVFAKAWNEIFMAKLHTTGTVTQAAAAADEGVALLKARGLMDPQLRRAEDECLAWMRYAHALAALVGVDPTTPEAWIEGSAASAALRALGVDPVTGERKPVPLVLEHVVLPPPRAG